MKKSEFIEKFGEEAWNVEAEKRREYRKRYNQEHKEENKEYSKWYYQNNKESIIEKKQCYYQDNREHIIEYKKQWREDNKEQCREYKKQYRGTQFGRANNLKNGYIKEDKMKGFPTDKNIDEDWIIENIFKSQCIYCGESDWAKLGADRIDNNKPHTPDNCVCACWDCNSKRQDKYTVEEFIEYRKLHPKIEDFI